MNKNASFYFLFICIVADNGYYQAIRGRKVPSFCLPRWAAFMYVCSMWIGAYVKLSFSLFSLIQMVLCQSYNFSHCYMEFYIYICNTYAITSVCTYVYVYIHITYSFTYINAHTHLCIYLSIFTYTHRKVAFFIQNEKSMAGM